MPHPDPAGGSSRRHAPSVAEGRVARLMRGVRGSGRARSYPVGLTAAAALLVALMVVVLFGSRATDRSAGEAQRAVLLGAAYQQAATGVAAEESLERKYRLEPTLVTRVAHETAERSVEDTLTRVDAVGSAADRALVSRVLTEHGRYVLGAEGLFAAVDRHESTAAVNVVDTGQVDPVFGVMQTQLYTAAGAHQAAALAQVAAMRRTGRAVLGLDAVTLLAGTARIAAAGVTLTRSRRRLHTQSAFHLHRSLHDTLTGLPNRTLFQDRTAHAITAARRTQGQVAVMLVDLNRFKDEGSGGRGDPRRPLPRGCPRGDRVFSSPQAPLEPLSRAAATASLML